MRQETPDSCSITPFLPSPLNTKLISNKLMSELLVFLRSIPVPLGYKKIDVQIHVGLKKYMKLRGIIFYVYHFVTFGKKGYVFFYTLV